MLMSKYVIIQYVRSYFARTAGIILQAPWWTYKDQVFLAKYKLTLAPLIGKQSR